MKTKIPIFFILIIHSLLLVSQKKKEFEIFLGDTINVVDQNNLKQGRWIYFGKDQKGLKNKVLKHNVITQDGHYLNDLKTGLWKTYHSTTNKLKNEITYQNGVVTGKAKFYTEKGKLYEEGVMDRGQWKGEYYLYNDKGEKFTRHEWKNNIPVCAFLEFKGIITKNGKPVEDVEISIERNDIPVNKISGNSDGTFSVPLDLQQEYIIYFSKKGFHRQSVLINTFTNGFGDTTTYVLKDWKVQLNDNLAASATNDLIGFLVNKPSNKIYFNRKKKEFTADGSYEHLFKKQLNDISQTTQLLMATTVETNKKLEIENLRIQSEAKLKEIELLKQQQELQQAKLKEREAELNAKKLEAEKKEKELSIMEKEKKIKELLFKEKENQVLQEQLETEKKAREIERLSILTKQQQLDGIMQQKQLSAAQDKIEKEKLMAEMSQKELAIANREKNIKDKELKENIFYFNLILAGFLLIAVFSFFLVRNIRQKKRANALLAQQTLEIQQQKNDIEEKSKIIEEKNLETTQSIMYAKRIQHAILPPPEEIDPYLKDYFILYRSKDIVSGDFYFFSDKYAKEKGKVIIAAVDCTGHGVPGAFMSLVGCEKLKDAVDHSHEAGKIIQELNIGVKSALRQTGEGSGVTRDGMDLSLCVIPVNTRTNDKVNIQYAGANRPLWIIRNKKELIEVKATKVAIGGLTPDDQKFEEHNVELNKGDTFYLFSDGFADQFGGLNSKKLMTKNFKELLISIQDQSLNDQKKYLNNFFEEWKGSNEQVDDILVIGIRV